MGGGNGTPGALLLRPVGRRPAALPGKAPKRPRQEAARMSDAGVQCSNAPSMRKNRLMLLKSREFSASETLEARAPITRAR